MGDNIYLGDRNGVRTPMQWITRPQRRLLPRRPGTAVRADRHGPGLRLRGRQCRGAVAQPVLAVSATKRLIAVRRSTSVGRGTMTFIRPENRSVLCYVRQYRDEVVLSSRIFRDRRRRPNSISPPSRPHPAGDAQPHPFPPIGELPYVLRWRPTASNWFELARNTTSRNRWCSRDPEFETLVVPVNATWMSWRANAAFSARRLPGYLSRGHSLVSGAYRPRRSVRRVTSAVCRSATSTTNRPCSPSSKDATQRGVATRYVLPMQIEWVRFDRSLAVSRMRWPRSTGHPRGPCSTYATDRSSCAVAARPAGDLDRIDEGERGPDARILAARALQRQPIRQPEHVRIIETDQPRSTALVDDELVGEDLSDAAPGPNPEVGGALPYRCRQLCLRPTSSASSSWSKAMRRSAIGIIYTPSQFGRPLDRQRDWIASSSSACSRAACSAMSARTSFPICAT